MSDTVELSPEVAQVAASVRATPDGKFAILDDAMPALAAAMIDGATQITRRKHAEELLALVIKYTKLDAERTAPACEAIAVLLAIVLGDFVGAQKALEGQGVTMSKAQLDTIGAQAASLKPIVKQAGSLSALDIRFKKPN
jgi:hypothetical protein